MRCFYGEARRINQLVLNFLHPHHFSIHIILLKQETPNLVKSLDESLDEDRLVTSEG